MYIDGINLAEGSAVSNLTVASGADYPDTPSLGELFYIDAPTNTAIGLYIYNGAAWTAVGSNSNQGGEGGVTAFELAGISYIISTEDVNVPNAIVLTTIGTGFVKNNGTTGELTTSSTIDLETEVSGVLDVSNLPNSGVTGGTYNKFTVDAKGRVTGASSESTLAGLGISNAYTKTETDSRIQSVVGAAPEALDTLAEIAAQLANDENAVTSLTSTVSGKLNSSEVTSSATPFKVLRLDPEGKLPADITGSAFYAASAGTASMATTAASAGHANSASTSDYATNAGSATYATSAGSANNVFWTGVNGTPTDLAGYGITDAAPISHVYDGDVHLSPAQKDEIAYLSGINGNVQAQLNAKQNSLGYTAENTEYKGQPNGYASLDIYGKVPASQLPSFVDDVLEFSTFSAFPDPGEASIIYVAQDTNKIYRWSGSAYLEISPTVGNSDTATKLATARTITLSGDVSGSASFDGSSNITITTTVGANSIALGTDTTGNFVSTISAGTGGAQSGSSGLTISAAASEGTAATLALSNTGVTAGTYTKLTVDAQGRVSVGTSPTDLAGYGITNAYTKTEVDALTMDGGTF